ncbi:cation:proton antiporter [Methyloferula stellata]|uniref:cation:proton antiporter n=1 Tax=Methyloferula stellata TaxID=876270 RepID=UPI00036365FD|nr:sodium:proton antiporter [Methyloferula stellata]
MALMPFDVAAILIVLAATFGYLNYRFVRLPASAGLTLMGAISSAIILGLDWLFPMSRTADSLIGLITSINFHQTLMNGMLSFLLFAGALHVDWSEMRRGRWPILVLSTIGVLISTALIGGGFFLFSAWLGSPVPLIWCLVFGSLISPTDPVAVMGVLKRTSVSPTLQATVAGESLFNDGVGVVMFSILLAAAIGSDAFSLPHAVELFAVEAGGGVLLGLVIGWIGFRAMRSIDDYNVEVMISLAVVMGGYALASHIGVSGPVAMAVAGILIGNHGVAQAMSDTTKDYLLKFWSLIDEILNAVLFLLIGLEVITVSHNLRVLALGAVAIPLALGARAISVLLPLAALRHVLRLGPQAPMTLIWGGLRGGISVALALSLPETPFRSTSLAATYAVVLFAVIVQGVTIERVLARGQKF